MKIRLKLVPDLFTGRTLFEDTWLHNPYKYDLILEVEHNKIFWIKGINLWLPKKTYTSDEKKFIKRWGKKQTRKIK